MQSILWWERARLGWRPEGYVLEIPHTLLAREAARFEQLLAAHLWRQIDRDLEVFVRPKAEPDAGTVEVTGVALLDADPQELRDVLAETADQARLEIEAALAAERPRLDELLRVIRG